MDSYQTVRGVGLNKKLDGLRQSNTTTFTEKKRKVNLNLTVFDSAKGDDDDQGPTDMYASESREVLKRPNSNQSIGDSQQSRSDIQSHTSPRIKIKKHKTSDQANEMNKLKEL